MQCPHCLQHFHENQENTFSGLGNDPITGSWWVRSRICPACNRLMVHLSNASIGSTLVLPKGSNRPPVPQEVPDDFSNDYKEACLILPDSPQASAALSRRCLQHIIREKAGIRRGTLKEELDQLAESKSLPSELSDYMGLVREIGNLAAHTTLDSTGEIVPVEPEEAEWCLNVVEMLFDYYFVLPAKAKRLTESLKAKKSTS